MILQIANHALLRRKGLIAFVRMANTAWFDTESKKLEAHSNKTTPTGSTFMKVSKEVMVILQVLMIHILKPKNHTQSISKQTAPHGSFCCTAQQSGSIPLYLAVMAGNQQVVKELLSSQAEHQVHIRRGVRLLTEFFLRRGSKYLLAPI